MNSPTAAANFIELFKDKIFFQAIRNNVIWTVMFLTIPVCIGMLAAMLLLSRKRTRSIYQVAFLIPYVLAPSVNAMLWLNVVFSPVSGVISVFSVVRSIPTRFLTVITKIVFFIFTADKICRASRQSIFGFGIGGTMPFSNSALNSSSRDCTYSSTVDVSYHTSSILTIRVCVAGGKKVLS